MKKKKGFTLIELLAVIVILAIIALIATPMVLKYIKEAKEGAGEQSVHAMVKAAETYYIANMDDTEFPMTVSFPDADNTLNLKNADNASGYLKINDAGDTELLITIDNVTYAKNYSDDKIYNSNKDNFVYEGSPYEWIVSERNPEKLITWKTVDNGLISLIDQYLYIPYLYYVLSEADFPTYFIPRLEKKETLEATIKEYEMKNKNYMPFVPQVFKSEMEVVIELLKNKFGTSSTDTTLISEEVFDSYIEEIKEQIPFQYQIAYLGDKFNLRLSNYPIDITTVIPSKVNGNKITKIANFSVGTGSSDDDCDDVVVCYNLYFRDANYYYNLIISEGIEIIGDDYFSNKQVYSLKLPGTIKEIGSNTFQDNHIDSLKLPDGITKIGANAFSNNEITGKLVIPASVTSLGTLAFANNKITEVVISKGITRILRSSFADNQITEVVIPASVTTIDNGSFRNNPIKKVTIEGDKTRFNATWTSIGFPAELMPS